MAGEQERILQILSEANSSVENESSALEDNVPQKLSAHDIAVLSLDHKRSLVSQLIQVNALHIQLLLLYYQVLYHGCKDI